MAVSFARHVNYSSHHNLSQKSLLWWAAFHMGQFKQHANLLKTLSPQEWGTNYQISMKMRWKTKRTGIAQLKKKIEEKHGTSLLLGERGKEYTFFHVTDRHQKKLWA